MTSAELERQLRAVFGPDWRSKRIIGPLGSFALRDSFEECGLPDPYRREPTSGLPGVWQFDTRRIRPIPPGEHLGAMARTLAAFGEQRVTVTLPEDREAVAGVQERSYTGYARRVTPVPGAGGPFTFPALTSKGLEIPEWQDVWAAPSVRIFDAYERWKRPWWARALAWLIAGYYAVKR